MPLLPASAQEGKDYVPQPGKFRGAGASNGAADKPAEGAADVAPEAETKEGA